MAPIQGMKASLAAMENQVEDSNKWKCLGQGGDALGHPQHHLVSDHVLSPRHCFVLVESVHHNDNKVGLAGM